jgi:hypothetical protein
MAEKKSRKSSAKSRKAAEVVEVVPTSVEEVTETPVQEAEAQKILWAVAIVVDEAGNIGLRQVNPELGAEREATDAEFEQAVRALHGRIRYQEILNALNQNVRMIAREELTNVLSAAQPQSEQAAE